MAREWDGQACWTCELACGGCPWTEVDPETGQIRFEPIPGWDAEPAWLLGGDGKHHKTYKIHSCPMKVEGRHESEQERFHAWAMGLIQAYAEKDMSASQIARKTGLAESTIYKYLKEAREAGLL